MAFPCVSTWVYGCPALEAAEIAVRVCREFPAGGPAMKITLTDAISAPEDLRCTPAAASAW